MVYYTITLLFLSVFGVHSFILDIPQSELFNY